MIIRGVTKEGSKFRPSQWAGMLVEGLDNTSCRISICEGVSCIEVDMSCEHAERFLKFAEDNNLEIKPKEK